MRALPEVQGVVAGLGCALFSNVNLVLSKFMQGWQWPYFFLAGLSAFCIAFSLAMSMLWQGSYHLEYREIKWVILRGLFGCASNVLAVCAVLAGAHVGSVGALGSVNTVVAALLGRVVLGEPLGPVHLLAVFLSLVGAVLISDPVEAIGSMGSSLFGNALALLGGICLGGMFISSRKSGGASSIMLTTSAMTQRWIVCWTLSFIPVVPDGRFELLAQAPPKTLLLFMALMIAIFLTNILGSVASKKCPAALSSTLMTGSMMASGYLLDILIFRTVPKTLTVIGAVLMFCAVVTMALTRLPAKALEATGSARTPSARSTRRAGSDSSLASFAAVEFAERCPEEVATELRPRQRVTERVSALPRTFGAPTAAA